jgi:hypothetical protein
VDATLAEREQRDVARGMSPEAAAERAAMRRAAVGDVTRLGFADPQAIRKQIEDQVSGQIAAMREGQAGPAVLGGLSEFMAQAASGGPRPDKLDQLQKLADLRKSGALTDEEFEQQKKRILGADG